MRVEKVEYVSSKQRFAFGLNSSQKTKDFKKFGEQALGIMESATIPFEILFVKITRGSELERFGKAEALPNPSFTWPSCVTPPAPHLLDSVGWPTFLILLISPTQGVLGSLLGGLTVLLPDGAGACVGTGHGGQAQAVSRGGSAHSTDGCLPLVGYGDERSKEIHSEDFENKCLLQTPPWPLAFLKKGQLNDVPNK